MADKKQKELNDKDVVWALRKNDGAHYTGFYKIIKSNIKDWELISEQRYNTIKKSKKL